MHIPLTGLLFSLATGIAIASYYALNRRVAHAGSPLQIIFWVFAAHLPPLIAWTLLIQPLHADWGYLPAGLGVVALTVCGNVLAVRALSLSPFSLMMPVMCLSPVFATLIGVPLLRELPGLWQWVGIALAVGGVLALYAPADRPWALFAFWPNFKTERGAVSMGLSAFSWSVSAPMDRLALRHADPAFHALFVFTGLVIFLLIWLTLRGEWRARPIPRSCWRDLAIIGAMGAMADILQLLALQEMPAGAFEAIKRVTSQLVALGIAALVLHERLTRAQKVGIAVICVGVPLVVV